MMQQVSVYYKMYGAVYKISNYIPSDQTNEIYPVVYHYI